MSTEITVYEKATDLVLIIKSLGEIITKSGMAGCEKKEQGEMLSWECIAQKKSPFEILREFHLVNGKLAMRADNMLARFMAAGGIVEWKRFDSEAAVGIWTFGANQKLEISYTIEDAKKALPNLWSGIAWKAGSGYAKDPAAQIRARCISKAVRMICPQAIVGLHLPDEITDERIALPGAPLLVEVVKPEPEATPVVAEVVAPVEEPAKCKPGRPPKSEGGPMAAPVAPVEAKPEPVEPAATPPALEPEPDIYADLVAFIAPFKADALQWFWAKEWLAGNTEDISKIGEDKVKAVLARKQHFTQAVKTYIAQLKEGA